MKMFAARNIVILGFLVALTIMAPSAWAAEDADSDGVPDAAEPVLGTDPQNADTDGDGLNDLADRQPVGAENKIAPEGKPKGLRLKVKVEDNFDPETNKDAADHLELEVKNTSGEALTGLAVFYSVKDDETGKMESYYKPLDGMTIKAGKTVTIHFDDTGKPGHFRDNPNSSYHKSGNAKTFTVQIAAAGYAPVQVEAKKDKGGAEEAD